MGVEKVVRTRSEVLYTCVSTMRGNGLVIYGQGLRKEKKKDKPVFSNDKVITFLLFFQ